MISFLIVVTFLLLTLVVALYSSKKTVTFQEYAVGHKQFTTPTLIATLLAMAALSLPYLISCLQPTIMQRVFMASTSRQVKKVFLYASVVQFIIITCILLIGVLVFVQAPGLPKAAVWRYIMADMPAGLQGLISVALLAMAMSTADSCLHACVVMVSHDILEPIRGIETVPYNPSLWLTRSTTLVLSLFAMLLAFYSNNLLKLLMLSFDFAIPVVTAPFILAIFSFRTTSYSVLVGMAIGMLSILAWNKWVKPIVPIDGAFFCMLINGLAIITAHYLLPQLEDKRRINLKKFDK